MNGQINPQQRSNLFEIRSGGIDEDGSINVFSGIQPDALYMIVRHAHTCDTCRFKLDPAAAGGFEQIHTKLLRAQPARPSDVESCNGMLSYIRKILLNKLVANEQIDAIGCIMEPFRMRRLIRSRFEPVDTRLAGTQLRSPQRSGFQIPNFILI